MRITPIVVAGTLAATAFAAAPATAAKKKPITKTWTITAAAPDPTNWAGQAGAAGYSVCAQRVPGSFEIKEFKAPASGKLKVTLVGFSGDWDLLIMDKNNSEMAYGGSSGLNTPDAPTAGDETATVKVKKAGTIIKMVGCNWAGSNSGTMKMVFTYA